MAKDDLTFREILADNLFRLWSQAAAEALDLRRRNDCQFEMLQQSIHVANEDWDSIPNFGQVRGRAAADEILDVLKSCDPCRWALAQAIQFSEHLKDTVARSDYNTDASIPEETEKALASLIQQWKQALIAAGGLKATVPCASFHEGEE